MLLIIIIMYIYHALINTLSANMIHIKLNMIFCTHVEHGPTKTIDIKYHTNKQTKQTKTNKKTEIISMPSLKDFTYIMQEKKAEDKSSFSWMSDSAWLNAHTHGMVCCTSQ